MRSRPPKPAALDATLAAPGPWSTGPSNDTQQGQFDGRSDQARTPTRIFTVRRNQETHAAHMHGVSARRLHGASARAPPRSRCRQSSGSIVKRAAEYERLAGRLDAPDPTSSHLAGLERRPCATRAWLSSRSIWDRLVGRLTGEGIRCGSNTPRSCSSASSETLRFTEAPFIASPSYRNDSEPSVQDAGSSSGGRAPDTSTSPSSSALSTGWSPCSSSSWRTRST